LLKGCEHIAIVTISMLFATDKRVMNCKVNWCILTFIKRRNFWNVTWRFSHFFSSNNIAAVLQIFTARRNSNL